MNVSMPDSTNDLLSRAQELHLAGKLAEAAELYGRANRLQPDDAECLYFHGLALFQLGRANEAVGLVRRAIALDASVPEYYCDLGAILLALGDSISSIAAVRQALSLRPDFPEAMFTLGNALCRSGQFDEGIEWYQRAITMLGNAVDATNNLGMAYLTLGRVSEAIECFDKRSAINPADASSHSNRIFAMHFSPQFGPIDIQNELACWNRIHAEPLSSEHVAFNNSRAINRPLRVGYVSADFREHVVGWNLLSWLPYHDRNQFHISCYSNVRCPDDMTRQLQSHVDCWRDISSVGDADAARLIRHDRVDILVDLSLHTSGNRLLVFARKPAPIQLTYRRIRVVPVLKQWTIDYPILSWIHLSKSKGNIVSRHCICLRRTGATNRVAPQAFRLCRPRLPPGSSRSAASISSRKYPPMLWMPGGRSCARLAIHGS
jgi:protein O-GlcNAc transferase